MNESATVKIFLVTGSDGTVKELDDRLVFLVDHEFSSPSVAAAVIHGGQANGRHGKTRKEILSSKKKNKTSNH